MGPAKGDGYTVTPRDLELVVNAINCTRLPFEIDYDKLSRKLGYKNAQSAKAAWNALKKKLDKVADGAPVVPSLTIEPEPMRMALGSPQLPDKDKSKPKKGRQPVVEASSETSEDEGGGESDVPPAPKPSSKKRKQMRTDNDDGDVSMAEDPRATKARPSSSKSSSKRKEDHVEGKKRHKATVPSSTSASDTDSVPANEPKTPRKKVKRKFTHLSVSDQPKAKKSAGKSSRELENEAFVAREKAFEAFGMRDEDEDDEEPVEEPPAAYVKRESESGESVR